jgi:hypothetical protein
LTIQNMTAEYKKSEQANSLLILCSKTRGETYELFKNASRKTQQAI